MSWGVYEITSSEGGVRLINGIAPWQTGYCVQLAVCIICELALKLSMKFLPSPLTTSVAYLILSHLVC